MKKVVMLVLAAIMLFGAVGCSTTPATQAEAPAADAPAADAPAAEAPAADEPAADAPAEEPASANLESVFIDAEAFPGMIETDVARTGKEAAPTKKDGEIVIGWAPSAMDTYYQRVLAGLEEEAAKIGGITIDVQAPSSQTATDETVAYLENWITQGVDAIAVSPADESSLEPLIRQATEAGIPVFHFNAPEVTNEYYVSNIGYDQSDGGRVLARWLGEHFKDAGEINAGFIIGVPGDIYTRKRMEGFNEVIAEYPNFNIIDEQGGNWVRADSIAVAEDMIVAHPEMNLMVGLFDEMTLGGLTAIEAAGLKDQIPVAGYENMREVYDLILNGEYLVTVDTGATEQGRNIARAVYKYCVEGEMVPKEIFTTPVAYDINNMADFPIEEYGE